MYDNMKKEKINIWPGNIMYRIALLIVAMCALGLTGFAFYCLFWGESILLFDTFQITNKLVQFAIVFPVALLLDFLLIKLLLFRIIFLDDILFVPKQSEMQKKPLRISCQELLEVDVLLVGNKRNGTIYQYLEFKCKDGTNKRMWIKPYTKKQAKKILEIIKNKGGLKTQQIDDLFY